MAKKSMRNQTIPKNTRQTASNSVGKNKKTKVRKLGIAAKILLPATLVLIITCGIIGAQSYMSSRKGMVNLGRKTSETVARAATSSVDCNTLKMIVDGKSGSTLQQTFHQSLIGLQSKYDVTYIYALYKDGDKTVYAGDSAEEDPASPGDQYKDDKKLVAQAFSGKIATTPEITRSADGDLITTYFPVADTGGKVYAVIACDYDASGITQELRINEIRIVGVTLVMLFISLLVMNLIVRSISRNLKKVNDKVYDLVHNEGDLTQTLDIKTGDETELMADNINELLAYMRGIMRNISGSSTNLKSASGKIATSLNDAQQDATDVSATMQEMAAAMEETSANLHEIGDAVENIYEAIGQVATKSNDGKKFSSDIRGRAEVAGQEAEAQQADARRRVEEMSQNVQSRIEASKAVEQINLLTENIIEITDQTNLLALNASIEAARAGEQGRGFAVVANEIGNLAQNSAQAAAEIQKVSKEVIDAVEQLAAEAQNMLHFMDETAMTGFQRLVDISTEFQSTAENMNDMMQDISGITDELQNDINSIKESTSAVNVAVEESAQGVTNAAGRSAHMVDSMREIGDEANSSNDISLNLSDEVGKFKLD
ncbi:MAG: methyl-accepting chemotaxis protein [Lachnospiraceae bacterium]|nr:methyl-accepting chemotaxis protein [Lachnospiraceae bacterium]